MLEHIHVHMCIYMYVRGHDLAISNQLNTSNTAWKRHCCADIDKAIWRHW